MDGSNFLTTASATVAVLCSVTVVFLLPALGFAALRGSARGSIRIAAAMVVLVALAFAASLLLSSTAGTNPLG